MYLALGLLVVSCKKDAPEAGLPPATQVGANTGGCLINERFVATSWGSNNILSNAVPALFGGFSFDSVYYVQLAGNYKGNNAYIMLFMRPLITPGTYLLNKNTQYYPQGSPLRISSHATFQLQDGGEVYVTNAQHQGQVVMTRAELINGVGIGAGTFEFTAASKRDPGKTVTISNGRFDCKQ